MITSTDVLEWFKYDDKTGDLIWKKTKGRIRAGSVAGTKDFHGYIQISFNKKLYKAHRLVWLFWKGEFPEGSLDHKNGNPSDNRIENLREVTHGQNMANSKTREGREGLRGVVHHKNRIKNPFRAEIQLHNQRFHLGCFPTPEEAHAAYVGAAKVLHGEHSGLLR